MSAAWFKPDPLTRKRWQRFRRNRRAWGSLLALTAIYAVSLGSDLLCNDRPLYLRHGGRHFFPWLRYYSQAQVLGNGVEARIDYARLRAAPDFRARTGNLMLNAPVAFGPHTVADPSALDNWRRATLTLTPEVALGRLNLTADGRVSRAVGCALFFTGAATVDGAVFSDFWRLTPELSAALAARFANRPAPALTVTLPRAEPAAREPGPAGGDGGAGGAASAAGAVAPTPPALLAVSLTAYEPRPEAPASVRLALSDADAGAARPVTLRFERRRGEVRPLDRKVWPRLSAGDRTNLLALVARSYAAGDVRAAAVGEAPRPSGDGEAAPAIYTGLSALPYRADCRLDAVAWPHRPVPGHWLGIDAAGRDVLARVLYGTRTALTFGLLLVVWAMLLGFIVGAMQGYFGSWLDLTGQRLIEIWSALPFLYVMILLGSVLGRSFGLLLLCYGLFNWIGISYYMRAEFLRLRQRPFVEAAKCQGLGAWRIMWRHVLPNALTPLITLMPFSLVGAIASITALDFLGFGLPPLTPSWGELLQQAQQARAAWWLILYPSLMLFTVMLLTVLIGEGLRDAFDPKPHARFR